jgi:hypothetical protein
VPAAVAIPAIVSAGASVAGGLLGRSAAKSAANIQAQSAAQAQKYIEDLLGKYNPQIGETAKQAASDVLAAGGSAQDAIRTALAQGRTDVLGGVGQANELLKPYVGLGTDTAATLKDLMAPGGELNRTFTYQDIQNLDPGYQFRMDQASKALQASAAARGGALGGGTLQALSNLNQNMASSEAGAAFSRLTQQQQDRFNRLNALLGTGLQAAGASGANITGANRFLAEQGLTGAQNIGQFMVQPAEWGGALQTGAAGTMASNAMGAGRSIADLMTGAGAARAAGQVGSANALTGMLGGISGAVGQVGKYYEDKDIFSMLKNPAISPASPVTFDPSGYFSGGDYDLNPWGG